MMLGKPLIVARATNIDRIVEGCRNGVVIKYGDVRALDDALLSLENEKTRSEMGTNSRQAYDQTYGWNKMKDSLVSIYADL